GPVKIFGNLHAWYTTPFNDDVAEKSFRLRRANIGAEGKLNEKWQYRVMIDPARQDRILKDFILDYTGLPHHTLRVGQFKTGLSFDSYRSAARAYLSEWTQVGQIAVGRDQGAAVLGSWKYLDYQLGLYNGEGDVRPENNTKAS